jgi:hypothetical protein
MTVTGLALVVAGVCCSATTAAQLFAWQRPFKTGTGRSVFQSHRQDPTQTRHRRKLEAVARNAQSIFSFGRLQRSRNGHSTVGSSPDRVPDRGKSENSCLLKVPLN